MSKDNKNSKPKKADVNNELTKPEFFKILKNVSRKTKPKNKSS